MAMTCHGYGSLGTRSVFAAEGAQQNSGKATGGAQGVELPDLLSEIYYPSRRYPDIGFHHPNFPCIFKRKLNK